jgi:hypothetical protein
MEHRVLRVLTEHRVQLVPKVFRVLKEMSVLREQ